MTPPVKLANPSPTNPEGHRAPSFTPGFSDALGDRQLVFDPAAGTSLEVLRFKPAFSDSADFERSIRERVDLVGHHPHASLSNIHAIEHEDGAALTLMSKHTVGRRVSELVAKAHGPAFALELIRLVTPALVALQRMGDNVVHGVLSPERIVVTRDGRLVVVEHVLGSAIDSMKFTRQQMNELGVAVPDAQGPVKFDSRTDIIQLGFIALSLLLGRKLDPADYPAKVPALLDEFVQAAGSPVLSTKMRSWLERALQISSRSFASPRDAQEAFGDLPDDVDVRVAESTRAMMAFPMEVPSTADSVAKTHRVPMGEDPVLDRDTHQKSTIPVPQKSGLGRYAGWAIAALAIVAIGEGVALIAGPYLRPAAQVIEVKAPVTTPSTTLAASSNPLSGPALPAVTPTPTATPTTPALPSTAAATNKTDPATTSAAAAAAAAAATPVASTSRFGGLTVTSPIELQVFKDGQLVGSTAASMALNEGTHNLEFVNDTLGFRFRQTVSVRNGQMTAAKIAVPNGRISINAVPWAQVSIDGKDAGETPIANFSLPIGTHEIVFKHPQLGERKQTVVVKVDGLLRVTQTLQGDSK